MKEKQYDPARNNENAPAPGMASVNTNNEEEQPMEETLQEQDEPLKNSDRNPPEDAKH